jgi:hypothetical protein
MKHQNLIAVVAALCCTVWASAQSSKAPPGSGDVRLFEMRTYFAAPGKLDDLHARFRDHTVKLFAKHGMENIGYWTPVDNGEQKLIYLLAYPSREARDRSWKAFMADPDWQKAARASEANGRLVARIESIFLNPTDYSPATKPSVASRSRLFELRTYTAAPGKLDDLNKRFRDHTVRLFTKHGIRAPMTRSFISSHMPIKPPPTSRGKRFAPIRSGRRPRAHPKSMAR